MKASETKFQPIIEGTKQYVVPLFQRSYSWERKEWEVLWEDVIWLYENDEPKSHFIGSIVTMPTVSVPEGVSKFLLIDGQQRLTTIFILLTLLRNLARSRNNAELAQEIEQTMLVNPFKKGTDHLKLLPTQVDRQEFTALVHGEPISEDCLISQCYQFFERKMKQHSPDISALNRVLATRFSVVSIVLDYDDNPHLVFESLNAKGRPLTQADLIRNYYFMRIHVDDQESIYKRYWEPMQIALEEYLTEGIRHYLMKNGSIVKQGDVYFTLKDRVKTNDALSSLKDVALYAGYYEKLLKPENEKDPAVRASLERLNRLEVSTAYPFLLSCYHDFSVGSLSAEDFARILRFIENYLIRRFVCGIPTSQLNKIFPLLYAQAQLSSSSNLAEGVRTVLQSRGYPKDSEFRTRLVNTKLYGAGERLTKTRLILETLEGAYQHKETPQFHNMTVEHIMPQTLTEWWQSHLGPEWEADHELCLDTLGNLTLTAYNSELHNDPFPKKKQTFLNSHLELNKYFRNIDTWNRGGIEKRSNYLADLALKIWPYFGDGQAIPTLVTSDGVTGKTPRTLWILGQRFTVNSWREVLVHTVNAIAELEPSLFTRLTVEYPRFIGTDPSKFRTGRPITGNYFVEVNLSSKDIHRFCMQVMESLGFSSEDWYVETESPVAQ